MEYAPVALKELVDRLKGDFEKTLTVIAAEIDSRLTIHIDGSWQLFYNSPVDEMTKPIVSLTQMVDVYKALGHPVRLRILAMLSTGELCACQITAVLKLAGSTVSAHLTELRRAGVLVERKEGRWVIFRHAEDEHSQALIATALVGLRNDARIEADARIVKRLRRVSVEKLCRAELDLARVGIKEPLVSAPQRT